MDEGQPAAGTQAARPQVLNRRRVARVVYLGEQKRLASQKGRARRRTLQGKDRLFRLLAFIEEARAEDVLFGIVDADGGGVMRDCLLDSRRDGGEQAIKIE